MTLNGHFMSKNVFGQQGCRALNFALARLSCRYIVNASFTHAAVVDFSTGACRIILGLGLPLTQRPTRLRNMYTSTFTRNLHVCHMLY